MINGFARAVGESLMYLVIVEIYSISWLEWGQTKWLASARG